jgi:signal transduction histidine kinase/DNA-binding response OmpR family regulator
MNALVTGLALLLACLTFTGYDLITFRSAAIRSLSTQAEILGSGSVSALLFNDPQSAEHTLEALHGDSDVKYAAIYLANQKPFASYVGPHWKGEDAPPAFSAVEQHWAAGDEIRLLQPVMIDGVPGGYIYIRARVPGQWRHIFLYAGIAAVVLLVSLSAALLVASFFRRSIANPIVHLAEVARIVTRDKNYGVQVPPVKDQGELTTLTEAFADMLKEIKQSEDALRLANDQLEARVERRTAELSAAKAELEEYSKSILAAKEELERASQFKDQFLSTMSHELRTPLNAVLGFSEMLLAERYGPLNERQQRYVNHIYKGGEHLLRLINDILDISKIEAGRLQLDIENVPVKSSFSEVVAALQSLVDKKSQTLIVHESAELNVLADPVRFRQILMNLLGNAIKFTPANGMLELGAKRMGSSVRIEVRDSGPGIPADEQARIFEAFHRFRHSDTAAEGTGLGLAITRRLVDLHGGTLGLESEPGHGSCFYFTLPLAAEPQKDLLRRSDIAWNSEGMRVVVIEDDPAAAQLLESQLSSVGYEVSCCGEPERAVEMVAEIQPAAVTLDLVMKPVTGWEILSSLKSDPRTENIPVIVVTVLDQKEAGAVLGADGYVAKPVDRTVLLETVERCLQHQGAKQATRPILVVEDDTATREFIVEALSRCGYRVDTASDGLQARTYVENTLPELVVLDLILPRIDGFQLLAEWRGEERTADLPILILTSKDLSQEEREYLRANVGALFSKQEHWQGALIRKMQQVVPLSKAS